MGSAFCMKIHQNDCYQKYSFLQLHDEHCCKQDCFTNKASQQAQLLESLIVYKAVYLTEFIMDYLPENEKHRVNDNGYNSYCNVSDSLCPIWHKHYISNKKLKIIICGDSRVGKTSLIKRFTEGTFEENVYYDPSIGGYQQTVFLNDRRCILQIEDYAGQQMIYSSQSILDHFMRSGHIFLCCFSINSKKSYEIALSDRRRIIRSKEGDNNWSIILVATKCDLMDDYNKTTLVHSKNVIQRTNEWNIAYIQTSAKLGINVNFLFEQSILEYWAQTECRQRT